MYPDNAFYEFYPADIVDEVKREHPKASVGEKNRLMRELWDAKKRPTPSMAELADALGL